MKQQFIQQIISKLKKNKTNQTKSTCLKRPIDHSIEEHKWFAKNLNRTEAEFYLSNKEIGVFLVRQSETKLNCLVLSVKVAKYINANKVAHYLIVKSDKCFKLNGFQKQFADIQSLVTHCSVIRDMLPVLLNLKFYNQSITSTTNQEANSDNYMIFDLPLNTTLSTFSSLTSLSSNGSC
jgi:hypothetical protein